MTGLITVIAMGAVIVLWVRSRQSPIAVGTTPGETSSAEPPHGTSGAGDVTDSRIRFGPGFAMPERLERDGKAEPSGGRYGVDNQILDISGPRQREEVWHNLRQDYGGFSHCAEL